MALSLPSGPKKWERVKIGPGPTPIETTEGWLLIYHGVADTCAGFIYSVGAALLEPLQRGLVAGADTHVGSGVKIVEMHLPDQVGIVHKQARRPEGIAEVAAVGFELGGQAAVEDEGGLGFEKRP